MDVFVWFIVPCIVIVLGWLLVNNGVDLFGPFVIIIGSLILFLAICMLPINRIGVYGR